MDPQNNKEVYNSHNVAKRAKVGDTLYVKAYATHLRTGISPTADTIAILLPCDEVVWHGAHETDKRYHKVSFTVKTVKQSGANRRFNPPVGATVTGYVFGSNLAVNPPDMELRAREGTGQINPVAYANTGGIKA